MGRIDNPDFPWESDAFRGEVALLRERRPTTPRRVLLLGGYRAPYIPAMLVARELRRFVTLPPDRLLISCYPFASSVRAAAEIASRALARRGWSGEELDVIGLSMGGIVGRLLLSREGGPRAARLFTLATPHRGSLLSERIRPDAAACDLRRGSEVLREVDAAFPKRRYELTCYATLRDWWVGATRAAPEGMDPIWLDPHRPGGSLMAHFYINTDRRILADLAMRLADGQGFARSGPPPRD